MILLALSLVAFAEPVGLVVRLNTGADALAPPVVATFTPPGGQPVSVELTDDGKKPDTQAGDGVWAGAGLLSEETVTVSLTGGGQTFSGGEVTWTAGEGPKDLDLSLADGKLTAKANRQGGAPASPDGGGGGAAGGAPTPQGGVGGAPTSTAAGGGASPSGGFTVASGGAPRPASATFPGGSSSGGDSTLFIAFGAGLLLLVGLGWAWTRSRGGGGGGGGGEVVPSGLTLVPEPGLLGPGTPSLSDGLFSWVAWPGELEAQVGVALATLAATHRVLVVARSNLTVPPVAGGPVFRVNGARPTHVGGVAEALVAQGGPPLSVLLAGVAEDEGTLRDFADLLPMGVGGVVLTEKGLGPLPQVGVRAVEGGYAVTVGEAAPRTLVLGEAGLMEPRSS